MTNEAMKAAAWAKFEQAVALMREALPALGTHWGELDERVSDVLNDLLDPYGYMLTDNSPDSRDGD